MQSRNASSKRDDLAEVDRLLDRVDLWLASPPAAAPGNAADYPDARYPIWQTLTELRGVRAALAGDRVKARSYLKKAQEGGKNGHAADLLLALE